MLNLLNVGNNIVPQPVSSSTNVKLILFALMDARECLSPSAPSAPPRNEFGGIVSRWGSRICVSADRGGTGGMRFVVSKDLLFNR